jgi:L-amino acid N-acyltransferase YncA
MIRRAELKDNAAIISIYNYYVEKTVAAFDLKPRTFDKGIQWFEAHDDLHPIIVIEKGEEICGWASLSKWAPHEAYDHTVELSIFVHPRVLRLGYGNALLSRILIMSEKIGHHSVVSRVAEGNEVSRKMHEKAGFSCIGVMKEVGLKFDRWLDVYIYQKIINGS